MRNFFRMTESERRSQFQALNLFFGALLGANLGVLMDLPPGEYLRLVVMLAASVAVLQFAFASRRLIYAGLLVVAYAGFITISIVDPSAGEAAFAPYMLKIGTTMGVWLLALLVIRLTPVMAKQTSSRMKPETAE